MFRYFDQPVAEIENWVLPTLRRKGGEGTGKTLQGEAKSGDKRTRTVVVGSTATEPAAPDAAVYARSVEEKNIEY